MCPQCGAKVSNKKPIYKKWWFWLIVVFFISVIARTNSGGNDKGTTSNTEKKVEENTNKQWVELIQLKGKGMKKSGVFTYSGGKARLKYEFNTGQYGGIFSVYVVKEGVSIMKDGGFPEVMLDGSETGESSLSHLKKGNYYLEISSANGSWTIIVEELK
jgi:hypothetical protein